MRYFLLVLSLFLAAEASAVCSQYHGCDPNSAGIPLPTGIDARWMTLEGCRIERKYQDGVSVKEFPSSPGDNRQSIIGAYGVSRFEYRRHWDADDLGARLISLYRKLSYDACDEKLKKLLLAS